MCMLIDTEEHSVVETKCDKIVICLNQIINKDADFLMFSAKDLQL